METKISYIGRTTTSIKERMKKRTLELSFIITPSITEL